MAGIYVHIPFCAARCLYCAFYSSTLLHLRARYIEAVVREYALRGDYLRGEEIKTIYIGGGTPSVLTREELTRLLTSLPTTSESIEEVTMECNPDDISPTLVTSMKALGVNRVSMGIQTFDDERLRFLHRRHTAEQAREAVHILREGGIKNISIDLMFGFPQQTIEQWSSDIRQALALGVEHISAYCLTYEEGTPLYALLQRGAIEEIDEETSRAMYYTLINDLTAGGFEQYEISNFCREGYRAKHNSNYWRAVPYIGLGAAAHSYDQRSRQWNISNIEEYIYNVERGVVPFEREELSDDTRYNELITTALRTREGIALSHPFHNRAYLLANAQPLIRRGLLAIDDGRLHLTRSSLFIADSVLAELMKV